MSVSPETSGWITRAEEDYLLARSALRHKQPLTYGACFHAQQCAEKYLKTVLVDKQQPFPKTHETHDLVAPSNLCKQVGFTVSAPDDQLDTLSAYAVQVRYPGVEPTAAEAQEALGIAKIVRRDIRTFFGFR